MSRRIKAAEMLEDIGRTPQAQKKLKALEQTIELIAKRMTVPYVIPVGTGHTVRFGVISDTHFGSLYCRADALSEMYDLYASEGVTDVLCAGDMLAGHQVYRGQEWELRDRGWDEQRARFAESLPRRKGIVTHFITGNHDDSIKRLVGLEPGPQLAESRDDTRFVGAEAGRVILQTDSGREVIVDLLHPGKGTAYALSYHPQKILEAMSGGTKPDILIIGHYHKAEFIPCYRNVACLQAGCFESQTPFMRRQTLAAHVGGWLVEVIVGEHSGLTSRVRAEFVAFYEPGQT